MFCLEDIDVQLAEVPEMYLLSIRKMVQVEDYPAGKSSVMKSYSKGLRLIS